MIKPSTIFTEDNLPIMRGMDSNSVDLIYLDPPFNSNRRYEAPIGSKAAGAAFKDAWTFEDTDDAWWGEIADQEPAIYKVIDAVGEIGGKGGKAYLIYMTTRLLEMHRILKPTGSLYLHCDTTMSHSLKMTLDAIFGNRNFRNEVIWSYRTGGASKRNFSKKHDVLLFYSKSSAYMFNSQKEKAYTKSATRKAGVINYGGGTAEFFEDEDGVYNMVNMRDVWDISYINSQAPERVGYPTQKPLALLRRVVAASSNEGDLILDPFCGCATTCIAAQDLKRQWIGIDVSPLAATLIKQRMEDELGIFAKIIHRKDIPRRSDQTTPPSTDIKHTLFGKQRGLCNGCKIAFPFQNFTRDHIVPLAKGGSDMDENLQLLCGRCNSIKGDREMTYLTAKLKEEKIIS